MERRTRAEIDVEIIDEWSDSIAPLFNDEIFQPYPFRGLPGGVTLADISAIDPSQKVHIRDGRCSNGN